MANNKEQISEGLLTSIVDNFFKSLQKGVADRYIKAAEKAAVLEKLGLTADEVTALLS